MNVIARGLTVQTSAEPSCSLFFVQDALGRGSQLRLRLRAEFHAVGRDIADGDFLVTDLLLAEVQPALDAHFLAFDQVGGTAVGLIAEHGDRDEFDRAFGAPFLRGAIDRDVEVAHGSAGDGANGRVIGETADEMDGIAIHGSYSLRK